MKVTDPNFKKNGSFTHRGNINKHEYVNRVIDIYPKSYV